MRELLKDTKMCFWGLHSWMEEPTDPTKPLKCLHCGRFKDVQGGMIWQRLKWDKEIRRVEESSEGFTGIEALPSITTGYDNTAFGLPNGEKKKAGS